MAAIANLGDDSGKIKLANTHIPFELNKWHARGWSLYSRYARRIH